MCLSVCHFVLVFFGPFGVAIASLVGVCVRGGGRGGGGWSWCFSYVCSVCACLGLSVSSSSWGLGRAAVYDWVTPWTFLLQFLIYACCYSKHLDYILALQAYLRNIHLWKRTR